ncbi:hypothetical protein ROHU_006043 [Labeo rohita]|uniref:Uncharacterized protein n=1 Tax=Labeo rohita TaxID=84645 RepID=A0A498N7P2_LABRO|nr:hypothetical protein ROHU_006043 [Labeo rohita]
MTYPGWSSEVEHRDPTREALRRPEVESALAAPHQPGSRVGQRMCEKARWCPLTTHCCLLVKREGEGSGKVSATRLTPSTVPSCDPEMEEIALLLKMWVPLGSEEPAAEQKQKETKDCPPGPPPGEEVVPTPSPGEQILPSLGRLSQGRLLLCLPPGLARGWMGWALPLRPATCRLGGGCCLGWAGAGVATRGRPQR